MHPEFMWMGPENYKAFEKILQRNIWLDFVERKPGSGAAMFQAIEGGYAQQIFAENFEFAQTSIRTNRPS